MSKARPVLAGRHRYAIGIGSNRALGGAGGPQAIVAASIRALDRSPVRLVAASPIIASRPIGPSSRTYANAAAIIETAMEPMALLDHLQAIERRFGRRRYRRWGARTLDLDVLLWSGGTVSARRLAIPHPGLPLRGFVLGPLAGIAPQWRHPRSRLTIRQLAARFNRPKPVDRTSRAH